MKPTYFCKYNRACELNEVKHNSNKSVTYGFHHAFENLI
jgi:hypothetical protein